MYEKKSDLSPALSIIVPIYNKEPWLDRCIDSLLGQTIKNIEIICIDDKSTDGSLKILREYEKKDSRIKVIVHEKNSGASAARNTGLAIATGEYAGFVDADDFVDSDFYEKLYNRARSTDADIAKGKACVVSFGGKKERHGPSFADIRKNRVNFNTAFGSAIYKLDFITKNKLDFPAGIIIGEDGVFLTKAVVLANKIEFVEDIYYHYIRQKGSLDSDFFSIEKLKSGIKSTHMLADFINDELISDKESYNIVFAGNLTFLLSYLHDRSCSFDGHLTLIQGAIELYKKCKHKDDLSKRIGGNLSKALSEENEVALFTDFLECITTKKRSFKLFNCIPILKIIYSPNTKRIKLFNYIPLLKIRKKHGGDYYFLFSCLPIIKKETKIL